MLAARELQRRLSSQVRHVSRANGAQGQWSGSRKLPLSPSKIPRPTLLDELFPDGPPTNGRSGELKEKPNQKTPSLPLPTIEELLNGSGRRSESSEATEAASNNAFRQQKTAILVLQAASKSLIEDDFRRLIPKGKHIEGWAGPGDIEKVFPGRDPITLEQSEHYFLIFRNPAHARAYQSNVMRYYRHARKYTLVSISSPPSLQPGFTATSTIRRTAAGSIASPTQSTDQSISHEEHRKGDLQRNDHELEVVEDYYQMLQDFALCSPSQRLQLTYMFPPFSPSVQRLLDQGGYLGDRAGRSVALWVEGPQITSSRLRDLIATDGESIGLQWDLEVEDLPLQPSTGKDTNTTDAPSRVSRLPEASPTHIGGDGDMVPSNGDGEEPYFEETGASPEATATDFRLAATTDVNSGGKNASGRRHRWILTFPDEAETRRFMRSWNLRDVPSRSSHPDRAKVYRDDLGDVPSRIRVEYLW